MGERYPNVQAALAGTKQYEMETPTLAIPPVEGAATETCPATQASTSVARAGTVSVLGVKRKAEDDEDVIDITSD